MKKNYTFLTLLIVLVLMSSLIFYKSYSNLHKKIVDMVVHEEKIHGVQAGKGLNTLLEHYIYSLELLSSNQHIIYNTDKALSVLKNFYQKNSSDLKGISILDRKGTIIRVYPYNKNALGTNVAHQDHNRSSLNSEEVIVSDVFTAVEGFKTIVISVPVKIHGKVQKRISVLLDFEAITEKFFKEIKPARNGYAIVFSRDGTLLYHPIKSLRGLNMVDKISEYRELSKTKDRMLRGKQGRIKYDVKVNNKRFLRYGYYMPIHFGNTFWSILVTTPENDIDELSSEFRNYLIGIFFLLLASTGLFIYILLRNLNKMRAQKSQLEIKNNELEIAIKNINELSGLLPICANCRKVRNDSGYWERLEKYIEDNSKAEFTHSLCPSCARELYPEIFQDEDEENLPFMDDPPSQ